MRHRIEAVHGHALDECVQSGGIAIIPTDTVYGLACSPERADAVKRLVRLKGRPMDKPSAVMFFSVESALSTLPALGARTRQVLGRLLPGGVTLLLPNPDGVFRLACGPDPSTLGIRVPRIPGRLAELESVTTPLLQTSANLAGGADPRSVGEIPIEIREGVDLVIDCGELPGVPSTVIDLRDFEDAGEWRILRQGAVSRGEVEAAISSDRTGKLDSPDQE